MRWRLILLVVAASSVAQGAAAQGDPPQLRAARGLRIDGGAERLPTNVTVAVNARGDVAIAMPSANKIAVFDSLGTRVATIGTHGEFPVTGFIATGPNSRVDAPTFTSIRWSDDSLCVVHLGARAQSTIDMFSRTGKLLRVHHIALAERNPDPSPVSATGGRGARGRGTPAPRSSPRLSPHVALGDSQALGVVAIMSDGSRSTARHYAARSLPDGSVQYLAAVPPIDARWERLFNREPVLVFAPSGTRFAIASVDDMDQPLGTFTLAVFSADGAPILAKQYPYLGAVMSDAEIDSILNTRRDFAPDGRRISIPVPKAHIPPIFPPIADVVIGTDDRIWMVMRDAATKYSAMIIDKDGTVLGTVALPNARLAAADADHFWMVERAPNGVSGTVVRYRLTR
ncbi:MAG TPA: hypothetical protein VE967_00780 [Gemmatimonadaceae bacterium]|nr:hypothetical protein [Gemmatimonadaceae bacterium]